MSRPTAAVGHRVAGALFAASVFLRLTGAADASDPTVLAPLRQEAITLVNRDRAASGLPALGTDRRLDAAAQRHASDMMARGYSAHVSPEGRTPMDRYVAEGGATVEAVAENIAVCDRCPPLDREQIVRLQAGWMTSPGHQRNVLGAGFERFGFGVATGPEGRLYAVQLFSGPGEPRGPDGAAAPVALDAGGQLALLIRLANARRAERGQAALQPSEALSVAAARLVSQRSGEALAGVGQLPSEEVLGALPAEERGRWEALSLLVGECGGCGRVPADADIRFFAERWLGTDRRGGLLDEQATHMGFVLAPDGNGKKTALVVIGIGR